ncbi:MAG: hypothetical protein ACFB10_25085 [Salibacteraceae bacterium]
MLLRATALVLLLLLFLVKDTALFLLLGDILLVGAGLTELGYFWDQRNGLDLP